MTCHLCLSIWDKEKMLPLDLELPFGVARSAWGDHIRHAEKEGVKLEWHDSEQDKASVDGVRCWWTDDAETVRHFMAFLSREHGHDPDSSVDFMSSWPERKLRFIFSLV